MEFSLKHFLKIQFQGNIKKECHDEKSLGTQIAFDEKGPRGGVAHYKSYEEGS